MRHEGTRPSRSPRVRRGSNKARLQDPQCCCAHALCAAATSATRARRAPHATRARRGPGVRSNIPLGVWGRRAPHVCAATRVASTPPARMTLAFLAGISALSFGRHQDMMPTPPRLGRASKYRLQNDKRVSSRPARNRDAVSLGLLHGPQAPRACEPHRPHGRTRGIERTPPRLPRPLLPGGILRGACKPCCKCDEREVTQCVVQRLRIAVNFGLSWRGTTSLGASLVVGLLCLCAKEVAFFCNKCRVRSARARTQYEYE